MTTDRRTSIRASQLRNFELTGYDIKNASISGSQKLIDGSVTNAKLAETYIKSDGTVGFDATVSGVTPTQDHHLATKNYVDTQGWGDYGSILTASGSYGGETLTVTVDDASVVFGSVLYCAADFNYERADASTAATAPALALSLGSGAGSKQVLLRGQICNTSWNWSAGLLYLSTISGDLTQTQPSNSGEQIQPLGWALSADTIFFAGHIGIAEL